MLPADWREVGQQIVRNHLATSAQDIERTTEVHRIPQRDRGSDQGQSAGSVLLCLDGAIAQAAEPVEADSAGESVARFTFVQLRRGLPVGAPATPANRV